MVFEADLEMYIKVPTYLIRVHISPKIINIYNT